MVHYICTGGCKGVSDKPGVCQTPGCPKHQHTLEACDCTDGKHHGAFDFEHDHEHSLPAVENTSTEPMEKNTE